MAFAGRFPRRIELVESGARVHVIREQCRLFKPCRGYIRMYDACAEFDAHGSLSRANRRAHRQTERLDVRVEENCDPSSSDGFINECARALRSEEGEK